MKDILYIKTSSEPMKHLDRYGNILNENHRIHLLSFASRDTIDCENVYTYGFTDVNLNCYLRLILNLMFFPKKPKIDVVFSSHREWLYGVLNVLFSMFYGKKSVVCLAGNIFNSFKYKRYWLKRKVAWFVNMVVALPLIKRADRLLPYNSMVKQHLIDQGVEEEKITVVRLPVDYSQIGIKYQDQNTPSIIKDEVKTVFFAGTLTKGKGMETFLNILEYEEIRRSYQFVLAGKDRDGYGERIDEYENTVVLGRVSENEVYRYYYHSDLFLFPSYSEGFPKVILEAFTCGLPIVARDISDIDLLADDTFIDDQELLQLLRENTYQRHSRSLPREFQKDYAADIYLEAVES